MPQININEIDESIYTRVANNNLLKVFVPGIATFGPVYAISEDGESMTEDSSKSFTDKISFRRTYGYNMPEQNPIKNDYSKLYAEQLLDNGAEVCFVRLNKGTTATFDIGVTDTNNDTITNRSIPASVINGKEKEFGASWAEIAKGINQDITNSSELYNQYKFCTHIKAIEAKYTGSFGNKLLITIQPVNSTNRTFTYQYATITVYKADFYEKTVKDGATATTTPEIKSVTKLESNVVTTNPFDTNYFEDVEFDFIKIKASDTARQELTIMWSNIDGVTSDTNLVSGFPKIDLKYKKNGRYIYNADALVGAVATPWVEHAGTITFVNLEAVQPEDWGTGEYYQVDVQGSATTATTPAIPTTYKKINFVNVGTEEAPVWHPVFETNKEYKKNISANTDITHTPVATKKGWDFEFNSEVQAILDETFNGIIATATTATDTNKYLFDCFAPQTTATNGKVFGGIVSTIYANLDDCYDKFTDPYIYDFDFITSGSLLNGFYTFNYKEGDTNKTISTLTKDENAWKDFLDKVLAATPNTGITTEMTVVDNNYASTSPSESNPYGANSTHLAMINLTNTRQDCIALLDPCENWEYNTLVPYIENNINTSYATMHSPYCYVNSPIANELILMPPSYIFLMTELETLISGTEAQKWFPPAGVARATARMVVKPKYEINSVILNEWQNDHLARVNPIMKLKQYGYVIYGNYTCRVADDVNSFSALDSLNVRITANCVKQQIFNTCMTLTFEPNNSSLWMKFYDAMDKYLLFMKRNDGVYDYRIQMDESTVTTDDINQLRCPGKVWINPTRTAEFFDIDFTITEAGVTFSNTVGEGE